MRYSGVFGDDDGIDGMVDEEEEEEEEVETEGADEEEIKEESDSDDSDQEGGDSESESDFSDEEEERKAIPSLRFDESEMLGGGENLLSSVHNDDIVTETEATTDTSKVVPSVTKKASQVPQPIPASERITKPFLTKYEKTRIIATRAQQISNGSMPLIEFDQSKSVESVELAIEELRQKKTPLIVRRNLPNGYYEDWKVDELEDHDPETDIQKKKM